MCHSQPQQRQQPRATKPSTAPTLFTTPPAHRKRPRASRREPNAISAIASESVASPPLQSDLTSSTQVAQLRAWIAGRNKRIRMMMPPLEPQDDVAAEGIGSVDADAATAAIAKDSVTANGADDAAVADATAAVATTPRDEIVSAILTISSALGLTKETLHTCVDLLDRYLAHVSVGVAQFETLSIACLWIAVKFMETPETVKGKRIKHILKRRRHSGNWTWEEILRQEAEILRVLHFRIMSPTILNLLQRRLHRAATTGSSTYHMTVSSMQRQLAFYFADLLLLRASAATRFSNEVLVDAIWFVVHRQPVAEVPAHLLPVVLLLFLAHRDNINPDHAVFKPWFALRCQYGPFLQAPWQVPYDPSCACRVCEYRLGGVTPVAVDKATSVEDHPDEDVSQDNTTKRTGTSTR